MTFPPAYPSAFDPSAMTPLNLWGFRRVILPITSGQYTMGVRINGVDVPDGAVQDWFDTVGFQHPVQKDYVGPSNTIVTVFYFKCPIELTYFKLYFGIP